MFAVVDILGEQLKVTENATYVVPRLEGEAKKSVTFKNVLMLSDESGTKIGSPYLEGVKVKAKVLEHFRDDTVIVFKKKRRTGYKKKNGHRQSLTKIEITKIG